MVKKALNLQQLIDLNKTVETMIGTIQYSIITNNAYLKSDKAPEINIIDLYEKLDKTYDQLALIKMAKHTGNSKKTKLKVSNQDLIFERSNLIKKQIFLQSLSWDKVKTRIKGKLNQHIFQISKKDIEKKLNLIENRIKEISTEMTNFNTSHTVKIKLYEELELL